MRRATVRAYRPSDLDAVYDVCNRTSDLVGEQTGPELVPSIYAGPYLLLEPGLAFVLADHDDHAVGYVLGTADTVSFVAAYRARWLPALAARYPAPARPPASPDERLVALLHQPERMILPALAAYPAHLHIDVLPGYQRAGHGRTLMNAFLAALHAADVPAVHLGVAAANTGAQVFYQRMGFHVISVPGAEPAGIYLGRTTDPRRVPEGRPPGQHRAASS